MRFAIQGILRAKWGRGGVLRTVIASLALAGAFASTPLTAPRADVPAGGSEAATMGVFGEPIPWTIIGLHAMLLPDGRVLSYGTNERGQQTGEFNYDIWDPSLGTDLSSHMLLPNGTGTDIFCSAQAIMGAGTDVMITGGDETIDGARNYSAAETEIFDPLTNTLRHDTAMTYKRWYPSLINMPNGDLVIMGGRENQQPDVGVPTPEVYTKGSGWRLLPGGAGSVFESNWYYPRAFLAPNGQIFVVQNTGDTYYLDPTGDGTLTTLTPKATGSASYFPALMFAPGKILSVRKQTKVVVIDINGSTPVITPTSNIDQNRSWANATVMADGKVVISGGSAVTNQLTDVAYSNQIWDPATGQWTTGASATKPRLYHSIAMLMPDATVLTGMGGAPGPVKNLNAEIYYPPYLYDSSGQPAARPRITYAPGEMKLGKTYGVSIASGQTIGRVTLLRFGSVTHSYNPEQRFMELPFTAKSARDAMVTLNSTINVTPPGYYMLFVFNSNGVPSIAKIVRITA